MIAEQSTTEPSYIEFLRVPALSSGLYFLPVDAVDTQQPHNEDEVYYVVHGRAQIRVADEDQVVEAGTMVYVPAQVPHYFHAIVEDLAILVLFAPAESTPANT
jgi:mannose-6-phosphate isomerase-like protein (cupin superfamily)